MTGICAGALAVRQISAKKPLTQAFSACIIALAKALNLDAIHDTVHEMARDVARHGKAFAGLLKRDFGK